MFKKNYKSLVMRFGMLLVLLTGMFDASPVKLASASTFLVTNTNSGGAGSLANAISGAFSGDTIKFAPALAGQTITLPSTLIVTSKHLILDGSGLSPQVTISGGGTGSIKFIGGATFDIYDLTISNFATQIIFQADTIISNSTFKDFSDDVIRAYASLTITGSTFSGNMGSVIDAGGGGPLTITNSSFMNNGGMVIYSSGASPTMTVTNSSFMNNGDTAIYSGSVSLIIIGSTLMGNRNGAIVKYGGSLTLTNTTIHQNQSSGYGAALLIYGSNPVTIVNSTITQNQSSATGAITVNGGSTVDILNSTVAGNIGGEYSFSSGVINIYNTAFVCTDGSECYRVVGATVNTFNSVAGIGTLADYGLVALADNGGPTQTMALLAGSSLVNAGDDSICANEFVKNLDQRGIWRPQGSHCDIGAYEYEPVIRYVKSNASGLNNGTSWTDAYTDLQSALSAASSGDEIWVAAGTYKPTATTDRIISFVLKNDVAIYGGFAGTETSRDQRNPATNITILSGDIDNNDLTDSTGVVTDPANITGANSYHVVTGNGVTETAVLDGFFITAGQANGSGPFAEPCNGHYCGGGMYNDNSSPTLMNVTISGNSAIYGGGMYNNFSSPTLTNVTFSGNMASDRGGGMYNYSGSPTLTNVVFNGNSVSVVWGGGGGMLNWSSNPTLKNIAFIGNSAADGGGIYHVYGNMTLTNATFSNNTATYGGGGMAFDTTSPMLTNVTLSNNSATEGGGGIAINNGNPMLTNVTFRNNYAQNGGGMFNGGGGSPKVRNTIFWGNEADDEDTKQIYSNTSDPLVVSDSVVQGGCPITNLPSVCTNIITADPLLGVLGNYGGLTKTIPLMVGSSAIDVGNDATCATTDQRGVARPQGSHCDIGAYEYQDNMPPTVSSITRVGASPTSAANVNFTITFSESVMGVNTSVPFNDFALTTTGVTGATITGVTPVSGATYTVTVNTGSGNGTVRLDVVDDDSIKDAGNNPLGGAGIGNGNFTSGEMYTINKSTTFGDVPSSHPYFSDIEILYANGYTGGCSTIPLNFCPDVSMSRAQAAVFMLRGNYGSSYTPPTVQHIFADNWVNSSWGESWAEGMYKVGLTAGCLPSPLKFCPDEILTNVQVGVFGLRLKYGNGYAPPVGTGTVFADLTDTSFWGTGWAEQAYADGLIPACGTSGGKPKFCPDALVTRSFGASVIVKAKNLTMP